MVLRWVFDDTASSDIWTVPINPNKMTDPEARDRAFSHIAGRTFEDPGTAVEWEFEGVIQTQAHHDELERWAKKSTPVEITDHLGRTWQVLLKSFKPEERRPTMRKPWRFTYSMKSLILRRVA